MVVAFGADIIVALYIRPIQYRIALYTLLPKTLGNVGAFFTFIVTHTGGQNFVNPAHVEPRSIEDAIINVLRGN
tara:strand:- start:129762 stop:129983 length:222 start_codon:yes stop_codon:yes gene_type:complete